MLAYSLYTMFAIGLAVMLTAVFRRLRRDDQRIAPHEENAAFDRRIAAIEADYGLPHDAPPAGGRDPGRENRPGRGQGVDSE
jgi:hypothetical protein